MGTVTSTPSPPLSLTFPPPKPDKPYPFKIGQYACMAKLGQGAYGRVYRAISDPTEGGSLPPPVAIKVQDAKSPGQINDILKEITQHRSLIHPSLVRYIEAIRGTRSKEGIEKPVVCIVLEYVEGASLDRLLNGPTPLSPELRVKWSYELMSGVAFIHSMGKVHRDLKPANLLVSSATLALKIADFGLARDLDAEGQASTICGTPMYMAPEIQPGRALKLYGAEVDVWSMGCILLEIVAGVPMTKDLVRLTLQPTWENHLTKILRGSGLPQPVWELIWSCLKLRPQDRVTSQFIKDRPVTKTFGLVYQTIQDEAEAEDAMLSVMTDTGAIITILLLLESGNADPRLKSWIVEEFCANIDTIPNDALHHAVMTASIEKLVAEGVEAALKLKNLIYIKKRRSKSSGGKIIKTVKYPGGRGGAAWNAPAVPLGPPTETLGWYWRPLPTQTKPDEIRTFVELGKEISSILDKIIDHRHHLVISVVFGGTENAELVSFDLLNKSAKILESGAEYELKRVGPALATPPKPPREIREFQFLYRGDREAESWIVFPDEFQSILSQVYEIPKIEAVVLNKGGKGLYAVSFPKLAMLLSFQRRLLSY